MKMDLTVDIKQHLRILKELGITGIGDEIELMAERRLIICPEEAAEAWDITTTILSYTGMGHFDSAMRYWMPSSDTVYSFDAEALDPHKMYTFFLEGISAISQKEFPFLVLKEYEAIDGEPHKILFHHVCFSSQNKTIIWKCEFYFKTKLLIGYFDAESRCIFRFVREIPRKSPCCLTFHNAQGVSVYIGIFCVKLNQHNNSSFSFWYSNYTTRNVDFKSNYEEFKNRCCNKVDNLAFR